MLYKISYVTLCMYMHLQLKLHIVQWTRLGICAS